MKIIIFELWGKFAHFRKFYTNSSSLSYSVPPRTTIEGIIAAILGYERDSYYEIFNPDNLYIAIRKMNNTRKIMQSLNYIRARSTGELNSPRSHTQIPFEMLAGDNNVGYRFYVTHKDENIRKAIHDRILNNKPIYPPYLGSASFNCSIKYIDEVDWTWEESDEYRDIYTVIKSDKIEEIDIMKVEGQLVRERMPRDFGEDRIIKDVATYIYNEAGGGLRVKINGQYASLSNDENIVFL